MSRWFRMYDTLLDDPKVQRLPGNLFKTWVNLLCLASKNGGTLPCMDDVAFALRMDIEAADEAVEDLRDRGLIDEEGESYRPHNWDGRQFKSDSDPTAADRQREKRKRDKSPTVTRDTSVTSRPPETEAETDPNTEAEREDARAPKDPEHWKVSQDIIRDHSQAVDDWELEFLHSIKWKPDLTKPQRDSLKAIQGKLSSKANPSAPLPSVKRGTPAYDAWIAYYRKKGRATFFERQDAFTVPSEMPPMEQAA